MIAAAQTLFVVLAFALVMAIPFHLVARSRGRRRRSIQPPPVAVPRAASERIAELEALLAAERARIAALSETAALLRQLCTTYERLIERLSPGLLRPAAQRSLDDT